MMLVIQIVPIMRDLLCVSVEVENCLFENSITSGEFTKMSEC